MPLCVICGHKLVCNHLDQHGKGTLEKSCLPLKSAVWVHVVGDKGTEGDRVKITLNGKEESDTANGETDDTGFVAFESKEPGPYTALLGDLPSKLAEEYDRPSVDTIGVSLTEGAIAYVAFKLPSKPVLSVRVFKKVKEDEQPCKGATVAITGKKHKAKAKAETKSDTGVADLQKQPADEYDIEVTLGDDAKDFFVPDVQPVTLTAGQKKQVTVEVLPRPEPKIEIADPKLVLVKRAYQGKPKPDVKPHRIPVKLSVIGPFDGTGELSCNHASGTTETNHVRLFPAVDSESKDELELPLKDIDAKKLEGGYTVFVEGRNPSGSMDETELTLTLKGKKIPPKIDKATEKITCVLVELNICACRADSGAPPAALAEDKKVDPGRYLHLQRPGHLAGRARLVVHRAKPDTYTGKLVLTALDGRVELFAAEVAADLQAKIDTPIELVKDDIPTTGKVYWVQGAAVSGDMGDTGFTLGLEALGGKEGDRVTVTVIKLQLDLYQSPTGPLAAPIALADDEKVDPGRYVQLKNGGYHYSRAKLVIRQPVPSTFTGNVVLKPLNDKVEAFAEGDKVPGGGQAAVAKLTAPKVVAAGTIGVDGLVLWADGAKVSGALKDTGFRLKLEDATDKEHVVNDGDKVVITVASFTKIKATIHPTPANTVRLGFAAPDDHVFQSNHLDEDFTANPPLVLMRNAQPDIALVVTAAPANLPIKWDAVRNPLDHASLGDQNAKPTLTPDNADATKAELSADNKGSFRIRPYLDCNGSDSYSPGEPSIPLNLVLANAAMVADNSAALQNNLIAQGEPDAVAILNGEWLDNWAACRQLGGAGMTMELVADVTGGGANGRLGLDRVFGGLVNMLLNDTISVVYRDPAGPTDYTVSNVYASNLGDASSNYAGAPMFIPGDNAPSLYAFPHLDTGRDPGGIGGETAVMGRSGVWDASANRPVGQRFTLRCIDSPGRVFDREHPHYPGALLHQIHYDQQFQASFCFWTNVSADRDATGDAADRVYSVLRIVPWSVVGDWNVDSTNAVPVLDNTPNPHTIATGVRATVDMGRAQDNGVEVRPPSGITTGIAFVTT
jgi:hypothetical protein